MSLETIMTKPKNGAAIPISPAAMQQPNSLGNMKFPNKQSFDANNQAMNQMNLQVQAETKVEPKEPGGGSIVPDNDVKDMNRDNLQLTNGVKNSKNAIRRRLNKYA